MQVSGHSHTIPTHSANCLTRLKASFDGRHNKDVEQTRGRTFCYFKFQMRASCQAEPHREGTTRVKVPANWSCQGRWWLPPGIPDAKQTNQKDHGFKAFLGNLARPCLIKECRLVVECLPSIPEAMGSISPTARKRGRRTQCPFSGSQNDVTIILALLP